MNLDTLARLHGAVGRAASKYRAEFRKILEHTSSGTVREANIKLISEILDEVDGFLDPNILVVKKTIMLDFAKEGTGRFSAECVTQLKSFLAKNALFMRRSQAESDESVVQVVAATALCYGNKVFRFDRKERDPKSSLYGKSALWQGCHVSQRTDSIINQIVEAGRDKVNESLFLGRNFELYPAGYTWNRDEWHFGFCLRLNVENAHTALDLKKKEFKKSRGFGLSGQLVEWEELTKNVEAFKLESWSVTMAEDYKAFLGLRDAV